jgi:hypothetical protein
MKRLFHFRMSVALTVATGLIACQPGCGTAKEPAGQAANQSPSQTDSQTVSKAVKKNITGKIGLINPKQHTITIKPVAASQQIQTQSGVPKAKEKQSAELLLVVDKRTKITGSALPSKGAANGEQQTKGQFGQLAVGQLVRVVYEEPVARPPTKARPAQAIQTQDGSAAQTADGKDKAKLKQEPKEEPKQSGEGKDDEPPVPTPVEETKSPAVPQHSPSPAQKLPAKQATALRAISIEILAPATQRTKDAEPEKARP